MARLARSVVVATLAAALSALALVQSLTACGGTTGTSSAGDTQHDGDAQPDGGGDGPAAAEKKCTGNTPVQFLIPGYDVSDPVLVDRCVPFPSQCTSPPDAQTTCDCLIGAIGYDDAGTNTCPGRGPWYCDRFDGVTYTIRCAPP